MADPGTLQAYAGFAQAIAGALGAGAVVWAANVARKTFGTTLESKRAEAAFELAKRALKFSAKSSGVYDYIRKPMSWSSEQNARTVASDETPEQTRILNMQHVVFERINRFNDFWIEGDELQWEIEAVFGDQLAAAVREILKQRHIIADSIEEYSELQYRGVPLDENYRARANETRKMIWRTFNRPDDMRLHIEARQKFLISSLKKYITLEDSKFVTDGNSSSWWQQPAR